VTGGKKGKLFFSPPRLVVSLLARVKREMGGVMMTTMTSVCSACVRARGSIGRRKKVGEKKDDEEEERGRERRRRRLEAKISLSSFFSLFFSFLVPGENTSLFPAALL
jgi:hypothetical protein